MQPWWATLTTAPRDLLHYLLVIVLLLCPLGFVCCSSLFLFSTLSCSARGGGVGPNQSYNLQRDWPTGENVWTSWIHWLTHTDNSDQWVDSVKICLVFTIELWFNFWPWKNSVKPKPAGINLIQFILVPAVHTACS